VFLDLHVKVFPEWRQNERVLDSLGVPSARRKGAGRRGLRRQQGRMAQGGRRKKEEGRRES
jgi:hypothetical protein